jgi:hypothetical protein
MYRHIYIVQRDEYLLNCNILVVLNMIKLYHMSKDKGE